MISTVIICVVIVTVLRSSHTFSNNNRIVYDQANRYGERQQGDDVDGKAEHGKHRKCPR